MSVMIMIKRVFRMDHELAKDLQWQIDSIIGEKTFFDVYKPEEF